MVQEEALAMVKGRSMDQRLGEGLEECVTAGMIIPPQKGEVIPRVSPVSSRECLATTETAPESGTNSKADALREAILSETLSHLQTSGEPLSSRVYRATVAVMVVVG